jgi:hypothetical protein
VRAWIYVQQRISGAFELDYVPAALFYLLPQGSNQLDVDLTAHAGQSATKHSVTHRLTSTAAFVLGFLGPAVRHLGCGEIMTSQDRKDTDGGI